MERESFIFYRSFYEAIKCMPPDVQAEIYPAICEYALFGRTPKNLSEVAKGMFTLIKPNIDVNTARFENGKKGGRKKKSRPASSKDDYSLTYEQEVEQMRNDETWRKTICEDFNISAEEYDKRLSRFLDRCNDDKERKGKLHHDSSVDCQSHLRYWMTKAYPAPQPTPPAPDNNIDNDPPFPTTADYTFNGGFGGMDD
ncbi:DUF6291 domain-containing protein [Muribaculum sp.]|uniref:DUF6291 domain-containing protein n=1 Tax=Muribaculum sp. TaxID=1918611 RepID=UPI00258A4A4E|nr:DUF6291 domain-containing protein [Muribaculum sp.]MCX4279509.1 DUF6291 domain-containing protein [Muribaculum sp.]